VLSTALPVRGERRSHFVDGPAVTTGALRLASWRAEPWAGPAGHRVVRSGFVSGRRAASRWILTASLEALLSHPTPIWGASRRPPFRR